MMTEFTRVHRKWMDFYSLVGGNHEWLCAYVATTEIEGMYVVNRPYFRSASMHVTTLRIWKAIDVKV